VKRLTSSIKLTFQVSDLDNADPVESVNEEGNVVEDGVEPAYITSSVLITKSGSSKALIMDLGAAPDGFDITNVAIYDKALATEDGAAADWTRRSRYMGPAFDTLDSAVQDAFQDFIAERGVNEALGGLVLRSAVLTLQPTLSSATRSTRSRR
jgi:complement component 1 Q subcomponent-binding protein